MASNINPTNIDITYPIAGQDNDTQGFRNNFTNIKNNLAVAKDEISNLQTAITSLAGFTIVSVPVSSSAAGSIGQVALDTSYLYICVADHTWKRISLTSY
ncbi:hypothetical protein UFOVP112_408 [uncultured Caudovirales phage]|uniref:Uncharacterized protein n=1 Tax=uncultured Caudovirales phage TaxID=2100421 RepID=A0A6J5L971_9CAUD|nr:hypothetical protein UFOVP112_408 [uncultured Caudovirales phage]